MTPDEEHEFYSQPENMRPQGPPQRRVARTGFDTIADLQDAPEDLRSLANFAHHDPHEPVSVAVGPDQILTLHRYANAIQEFLDGTSHIQWKAYAWLGAFTAVGFLAGAVTMMVLTR